MFGVYFFAGSFVGFIALLSVVTVAMRSAGLLETVVSAEHLHDVGKFLFAFTAFWAYIAFSQFFLVWYANMPEETIWYKARLEGSWKMVSIFLMAGHFGAPFLYLMGRRVKRKGATLALGGAWLLAHALRGYLLAGHADAPSGRHPSLGCWTWPRSSPSVDASWQPPAGCCGDRPSYRCATRGWPSRWLSRTSDLDRGASPRRTPLHSPLLAASPARAGRVAHSLRSLAGVGLRRRWAQCRVAPIDYFRGSHRRRCPKETRLN